MQTTEEVLQSVLDTLSANLAILDGTGRVLAVNERWRRFGRANGLKLPKDGVGADYLAVCDAATGPGSEGAGEVGQALREILAGERDSFTMEYTCHSPHEGRWYVVRLTRLPGNGRARAVAAHEDVTEQRVAERRLAQALAEQETIFQAIPDIVYLLDPQGNVKTWNKRFEDVTGYLPEELADAPVTRFFEPHEAAPILRALEECLATGRAEAEVTIVTRKGRRIPHQFLGATITDDEGRIVAITGVGRDISARKRAEDELRRQRDRLETLTQQLLATNRELEAFSYSVSHDLGAPIRAIDYLSTALLEDHGETLQPEVSEHVGRIREQATRMQGLIEDLLKLSRISRGELRREPVDVSTLAHEVVEALRRREPARAVDVLIEPGIVAEADPHLLRVVLENLLGNAWKYTSKEQRARIELGEREGPGGEVVYYVRDNGAGFDMAQAHRIFQPFTRLHPKTEYEGTGIGLATVARIVDRHGGRVWAEGVPDVGATISFTLQPAGRATSPGASGGSAG